MPIEDFIIEIYVFVDNFLKGYKKLRQRGPAPALSDAEVITIEIVGEFLGFGTDKAIFDYFKNHWKPWFPNLSSRPPFVKQVANLWCIKEELRKHIVTIIRPDNDLFLFDGFPIPTCHKKRVRSKNPLKGIGGFGYCAAKDQKYFGFKGHLLTTQQGLILNFTITAANVDERDVLPELVTQCRGTIIADKGLIRSQLTQELARNSLKLETPLRNNMKESRSKDYINQIMDIRRTIETVISQLVQRFKFQTIRAKDQWHLTAKAGRKILAHTMAFFLQKSLLFDAILA